MLAALVLCAPLLVAHVSGSARWRARRKSVGRNCVARRGKDSIGRVAADRKAGADYAGNSKCCSRGKKLVGVGSEAWAVVGWKSTDETV